MENVTTKRIAVTDREYEDLLDLRDLILRKPIGLNLRDEDLSDDAKDMIFVAMENERMIGCVMMHPTDHRTIRLRQMAVIDELQGKGFGRMLVAVAEAASWDAGYRQIILHARIEAKGFYERLGYTQQGGIFIEVNIPHVTMEKTAP